MDPSFGARLRAQRERQQVALSAISAETKIKLPMLEGLERDDVSQWPEGIYRRAYVRAYARAVGLDPDTLVREFLEAHPDPVVTPPAPDTELENPPWPSGFRRLITSAIAAVPSRPQRVEQARLEPAHEEVAVGPEPELSVVADDDGHPAPELSPLAVAEVCTRLGRVLHRSELGPILHDAARALDAVGLVLWSWDSRAAALKPCLASGYPEALLARMPSVRTDEGNAIAAAFQSARTCVVNGGDGVTGALVVPLMSHSGCVGVLAVEFQHGDEQRDAVRAFAAILAAQLATVVGSAPLAEAVNG